MFQRQSERRFRSVPSWQALSAKLVRYNVCVGTNIAEYWYSVAEINYKTLLTLTDTVQTPLTRRRRFTVIQGGKYPGD
jgi:hypothetical protein